MRNCCIPVVLRLKRSAVVLVAVKSAHVLVGFWSRSTLTAEIASSNDVSPEYVGVACIALAAPWIDFRGRCDLARENRRDRQDRGVTTMQDDVRQWPWFRDRSIHMVDDSLPMRDAQCQDLPRIASSETPHSRKIQAATGQN